MFSRSMTRREWIGGAAAMLASAQTRKPNIVLIVLDDAGYGDLGCYGQQSILTPNIDRIAKEGLRFTDFHAGAAVCAPSRASLMTGLHGGHAPIRANAGTTPVSKDDLFLSEILKANGYATGCFGKWGLGDVGSEGAAYNKGFDRFFGYMHQTHAHTYYPDFLWDNDRKVVLKGNASGARGEYSADLIAERTVDFVRAHRDRPFFLFAAWTQPHARFEPPELGPYADKSWPAGAKAYAAMLTRADRHVGDVMRVLRENRLDESTLVIVTSDNGAHDGPDKGFKQFRSNGALRGEKGELYEGGIRVPAIFRWPGRIAPGGVSNHTAAFCDFLPTFVDVAGAKPPESPIDGISLLPGLTGKPQPKHEFLYWEHQVWDFDKRTLRADRMWQAVREGNWKAIRRPAAAATELYDLEADLAETRDLATGQAALVKAMERRMRDSHRDPPPHDRGSRQWVT
jgi:arylsulfatase A-like enzyme